MEPVTSAVPLLPSEIGIKIFVNAIRWRWNITIRIQVLPHTLLFHPQLLNNLYKEAINIRLNFGTKFGRRHDVLLVVIGKNGPKKIEAMVYVALTISS